MDNNFDDLPAIIQLRSHIRYLNGMIAALEREQDRLDSQPNRSKEIKEIEAKTLKFTKQLINSRQKLNNWRNLHYAYRTREENIEVVR